MSLSLLNTNKIRTALEAFVAAPAASTIEPLLRACRGFILRQAFAWRQTTLSLKERCREIMSEMFLILMEDLKPNLLSETDSLLTYLGLRLRRLTRPYRRSWQVAFGLIGDLPDSGRCCFTPFRLDLMNEIVAQVRSVLVSETKQETRELEFLFIHIQPDLGWASHLLATKAGLTSNTRYEADKKRHQLFHRQIRTRLENLKTGDWRDIANWSAGERRHLGWRIIELSAAEAAKMGTEHYQTLQRWRENPALIQKELHFVDDVLASGLEALAAIHLGQIKSQHVAADEMPYISYLEEQDLFSLLFHQQPPGTRFLNTENAENIENATDATDLADKAINVIKPNALSQQNTSYIGTENDVKPGKTIYSLNEPIASYQVSTANSATTNHISNRNLQHEDKNNAFEEALIEVLAWTSSLIESRVSSRRLRYPTEREM